MSKLLYLIRHSYAEGSSGKSDFDRPLTSEGSNTTRALGRYLIKSSFNPAIILCSTALRTRETALNLIEELEISDKNVVYKDDIYNASVRELLNEVNTIQGDMDQVAIIGHNPTITYFAEYLTNESIGNMDPGSMATISFEKINWSEVTQASGQLISYVHPKQLNV